jgi:hypothetical protein
MVLIGYDANIVRMLGISPLIVKLFFLHTLGVPTRYCLTLAESINQDGLGRSNPRRVYSNLRHTLGHMVPQKRLGL